MSSGLSAAAATTSTSEIAQYDEITKVMEHYCEGVRTGDPQKMKLAFHEKAGFFGIYNGKLLAGPIQILYDVTTQNGPSPNVRFRITSIDAENTLAVVKIELDNYTGKLAGEDGATLSDVFTLIKNEGKWMISQKSFHWHV